MVERMPRMLRDIIENAIAQAPDMELLPPRPAARRRPRARATDPDVVVVATPRLESFQLREQWLEEWPRARILVVETSGRRSVIYELRPHATPLGELSPAQLVEVIRTGRAARRE
jgi:hypothetical protein